jgi:motility quorum-sensing regulator/GCU-specific mRNA interferase toxin
MKHLFPTVASLRSSDLAGSVYHVPSPVGTLYVKFTADVVTEFVLLSFKEKDND